MALWLGRFINLAQGPDPSVPTDSDRNPPKHAETVVDHHRSTLKLSFVLGHESATLRLV
jgi:hypothetical protein